MFSTSAEMSTRFVSGSGSRSTTIEARGTLWQSGMSSLVRFAAMMPATRATPRTSPFCAAPANISANASSERRISPFATARRFVRGFAPTFTIRAAPVSSMWVSFAMSRRRVPVGGVWNGPDRRVGRSRRGLYCRSHRPSNDICETFGRNGTRISNSMPSGDDDAARAVPSGQRARGRRRGDRPRRPCSHPRHRRRHPVRSPPRRRHRS
jgi:hypothetical protein